MISFGTEGNIYYSVFHHLKDNLVASGIGSGGISGTFMEGYPDQDQQKRIVSPEHFLGVSPTAADSRSIALPVLTFEEGTLSASPIELGSDDEDLAQAFVVSVFANSPVQKRQLTNQVRFNLTKKSISLKDYGSNFESPATVGTLHVDKRNVQTFHIQNVRGEELPSDKLMRHRAEIVFSVNNK